MNEENGTPKRSLGNRPKVIALSVIAIIVVGLILWVLFKESIDESFIDNAQEVRESVVFIITCCTEDKEFPYDMGTGVAIDGDGYILTVDHLLHEKEERISVLFIDSYGTAREVYEAKRVKEKFSGDLALIKIIPNHKLKFSELNGADDIKIGTGVGFFGFSLPAQEIDLLKQVTEFMEKEISPTKLILFLNRGLISTRFTEQKEQQEVLTEYYINGFTNPMDSGGPVFLSQSGEVIGIVAGGRGSYSSGIVRATPIIGVIEFIDELKRKDD